MSEHRLTHEPEAAGQACAIATDEVRRSLPADADAFLLMTTELVTNAVRHAPPDADGKFTLKLEVIDTTARAIVIDAGPEFEFDRATFDADTDNHFGLRFVDQLASRWGLSLDGEKAVRFEVDR
jgi:two-component sensor histidine kinase